MGHLQTKADADEVEANKAEASEADANGPETNWTYAALDVGP
jgi:hypothetical protein